MPVRLRQALRQPCRVEATTFSIVTANNGNNGAMGTEHSVGYQNTFNVTNTITINTGMFFNSIASPSLSQAWSQVVILLHEFGHASAFMGLPTVVTQDAGPGFNGTPAEIAAGTAASFANNSAIAAACPPAFGDGDANFNPDPGSVDGSGGPVDAVKKKRRKF